MAELAKISSSSWATSTETFTIGTGAQDTPLPYVKEKVPGAVTSCPCDDCETLRKKHTAEIEAKVKAPLSESKLTVELPDVEEWVKKHFPKGSVIVKEAGPGAVASIKQYLQSCKHNWGEELGSFELAEKVVDMGYLGPSFPKGRYCAGCNLGISHRIECSCGHTYREHRGHNCSQCFTESCFPWLTLTGHWVTLPLGTILGTVGKCTCPYCTTRAMGKRPGIRYPRPTPKPIEGWRMNEVAVAYGLDANLILVEAAADFYLLIEMGAMEPLESGADEILRGVTSRLADQLCLYLELACLGEFRYTGGDGVRARTLPGYSWEKGIRDKVKALSKDVYERLDALGPESKSDSRMAAWSLWSSLREKHGDEIYKLIIEGFRGLSWGRSDASVTVNVGGPKWAVCMEAAYAYRKGLPATVFVDQALSLKHNGNIAYDKFFDVRGLAEVISWALTGETSRIQHYASVKVRELWQAWRSGRVEKE